MECLPGLNRRQTDRQLATPHLPSVLAATLESSRAMTEQRTPTYAPSPTAQLPRLSPTGSCPRASATPAASTGAWGPWTMHIGIRILLRMSGQNEPDAEELRRLQAELAARDEEVEQLRDVLLSFRGSEPARTRAIAIVAIRTSGTWRRRTSWTLASRPGRLRRRLPLASTTSTTALGALRSRDCRDQPVRGVRRVPLRPCAKTTTGSG